MKMPTNEYESLKADYLAMVAALQERHGPLNYSERGMMWRIYHRVCDDRSYDDSHPFYIGESPRPRVLAFIDWRWNSKFYDMGLNDSHIETALRRIVAA